MSLPTKARSINTTTELTIIVSWGTGTQWKSVCYPSTIHGFIVGGSLLGSLWLWLSNINTTHMLFASDLYESSELCWVNGNPSKLVGSLIFRNQSCDKASNLNPGCTNNLFWSYTQWSKNANWTKKIITLLKIETWNLHLSML